MKQIKFIDFCSGIGGGRQGLELAGMKCIAHSEIDIQTSNLYSYVYNDNNNLGDLTKININDLPNFDLLISGFPKNKEIKPLKNFLIDSNSEELPINDKTFNRYLNNKYNKGKYNLEEILKKDYLILDTRQSDLRIYKDRCPTLRTGRHGILYIKNRKIKKLSSIEGFLLQGFSYKTSNKAVGYGLSNNKLLSIIGNAMTVNVIKNIAEELLKVINNEEIYSKWNQTTF
ncbi:MAG: DNA cytosine methyltransferase [Defluviitaleaceae bacterium]|nr:DNA cytosine methyltransferase [Defluviitaleaceae bacterium]